MGQFCKDYEIRLHRNDGKLSLVAIIPAVGDEDAKRLARKLLQADLTNAYIPASGGDQSPEQVALRSHYPNLGIRDLNALCQRP